MFTEKIYAYSCIRVCPFFRFRFQMEWLTLKKREQKLML